MLVRHALLELFPQCVDAPGRLSLLRCRHTGYHGGDVVLPTPRLGQVDELMGQMFKVLRSEMPYDLVIFAEVVTEAIRAHQADVSWKEIEQ